VRRRRAVISADHDCSQEVIDAARSKNLRLIAVGGKADGAGEGIRLVQADIDGFAQKLVLEHRGQAHDQAAAVGEFQIENALVAAGSRSVPAARRLWCSQLSNISKAPRDGSSASANITARRSLSTTRTSPMRWQSAAGAAALRQTQARRHLRAVATATPQASLMGAIASETPIMSSSRR